MNFRNFRKSLDAKRFIGKQFDDPQIKADMTLSTFKIVDIEVR